ncbi:hypothetical protein W824_08980 [Clavibacter cf. michiganensis LMG 26808]|nr:hypothetical protein W824_08980 [Clavibacter cf. michiganensis LMG 26808]
MEEAGAAGSEPRSRHRPAAAPRGARARALALARARAEVARIRRRRLRRAAGSRVAHHVVRDARQLLARLLELASRRRGPHDARADLQPRRLATPEERAQHQGRVERAVRVDPEDRAGIEAAVVPLQPADEVERGALGHARRGDGREQRGQSVPAREAFRELARHPGAQVLHRAALLHDHELLDAHAARAAHGRHLLDRELHRDRVLVDLLRVRQELLAQPPGLDGVGHERPRAGERLGAHGARGVHRHDDLGAEAHRLDPAEAQQVGAGGRVRPASAHEGGGQVHLARDGHPARHDDLLQLPRLDGGDARRDRGEVARTAVLGIGDAGAVGRGLGHECGGGLGCGRGRGRGLGRPEDPRDLRRLPCVPRADGREAIRDDHLRARQDHVQELPRTRGDRHARVRARQLEARGAVGAPAVGAEAREQAAHHAQGLIPPRHDHLLLAPDAQADDPPVDHDLRPRADPAREPPRLLEDHVRLVPEGARQVGDGAERVAGDPELGYAGHGGCGHGVSFRRGGGRWGGRRRTGCGGRRATRT